MVRSFSILIFIILTACTSGVHLESVNYNDLFHDGNSKVWLVNKVMVNNAVISSVKNSDKHVLIFHENNACEYIAMKDITRKSPERGYFILNSELRTVYIEFEDDHRWEFTIAYIEEDSILLEPTSTSDANFTIQLTPFPEL
ncbi:MAG: hypothetical protein QNK23_10965 [Crocinitomicaceae bacterium]|nr:hypothetical protein [Crocinitomicaceae bacterium]